MVFIITDLKRSIHESRYCLCVNVRIALRIVWRTSKYRCALSSCPFGSVENAKNVAKEKERGIVNRLAKILSFSSSLFLCIWSPQWRCFAAFPPFLHFVVVPSGRTRSMRVKETVSFDGRCSLKNVYNEVLSLIFSSQLETQANSSIN